MLLTRCLLIVTHCHNTNAKRRISLSPCHQAILKSCADDSRSFRILVEERTSFDWQFWKKIMWRWLMRQLVLRESSCPNGEWFVWNWQSGKCASCAPCQETHYERASNRNWAKGACSTVKMWNLSPLNGRYALNPDFQRFKNLDPSPFLRHFTDPPLWSPSPPPHNK